MTARRSATGAGSRWAAARLAAALTAWFALQAVAPACPFCTTLEPTLAQRRDAADSVALVEVDRPASDGRAQLVVRQWLKRGDSREAGERPEAAPAAGQTIQATCSAAPGTLAVAFGDAAPSGGSSLEWSIASMQERALGYFVQAPDLKTPPVARLEYFARFLEHPDPLIAADAYAEFGYASFADVTPIARTFDTSKLRPWVAGGAAPQRCGLYALMLGLAADAADRAGNLALLEQIILSNRDDFRAGFDGVLAGYLLLAGEPGLELIDRRYLADRQAASGHVRQAMRALRFYLEYGREIPAARLAQSARLALGRAEVAADAIKDLARWQEWSAASDIAALWDHPDYADQAIRLSIVGYLLSSPRPEAAAALGDLRARDAAAVAAAEREFAAAQAIGR